MEYRRESENSDKYYQEEYISDREKANLKTKKKIFNVWYIINVWMSISSFLHAQIYNFIVSVQRARKERLKMQDFY